MRLSQLFTTTAHQVPADEQSRNAKLLIKAGYIHKEMAGVYDFLPLGLRVLNKIIEIIREEMNTIGGQEVYMSALQPKEHWQTSGRWHDDVVDVWFKTRTHSGKGYHLGPELGLSNTHEEAITAVMKGYVKSYKDLPAYPYQFQTKFRNEPRPRSGLIRCREFIMKDLYSFSRNQTEHDQFYEIAKSAYTKIFDQLGIGHQTYLTFASGGSFAKFSHEFQTVAEAGEDTIYVNEAKKLAVNKDVLNDEVLAELGLKKDDLTERRAIEVGNIFTLGTRFSEPLGLVFADESGARQPVIMGSYGIGPARVMATIVELMADDKGLVWPQSIAPAHVHLVALPGNDQNREAAEKLYSQLTAAAVEVIYDDRGESAGKMFADADLLGIPLRLVISEKTLADGGYELKNRTESEAKLVPKNSIIDVVKQ